MEIDSHYSPQGDCPNPIVHERDEVQITQLLGPDGKPYAIRRKAHPVGFRLVLKK